MLTYDFQVINFCLLSKNLVLFPHENLYINWSEKKEINLKQPEGKIALVKVSYWFFLVILQFDHLNNT